MVVVGTRNTLETYQHLRCILRRLERMQDAIGSSQLNAEKRVDWRRTGNHVAYDEPRSVTFRGILACDVLTPEGEHDRIPLFTPAIEPTFLFWKLQPRIAHARNQRIFSVNKTIQRSDFANVTTLLWCSEHTDIS